MSEMTPNRRQLFVFGDSNSVFKDGWVSDLKYLIQDDFDLINRSVGGTSSLMGYYRLTKTTDINPGDIAIWAYGINDFCQYTSGASLDVLLEDFAFFIQKCQQRNLHVLPVLMKTRYQSSRKSDDEFTISYLKFMKKNKLHYINCDKILKSRKDKNAPSQYKDDLHHLSGGWLNKSIAEHVQNALKLPYFSGPPAIRDFDALKDCHLQVISDGPTDNRETFKNSLVEETYYSIPFEFKNVPTGKLKAVIVMASAKGGATGIVSEGRLAGYYPLRNTARIRGDAHDSDIKPHLKHISIERSDSRPAFPVSNVVKFERPEARFKPIRLVFFNSNPYVDDPRDGVIALIVLVGTRRKKLYKTPLFLKFKAFRARLLRKFRQAWEKLKT